MRSSFEIAQLSQRQNIALSAESVDPRVQERTDVQTETQRGSQRIPDPDNPFNKIGPSIERASDERSRGLRGEPPGMLEKPTYKVLARQGVLKPSPELKKEGRFLADRAKMGNEVLLEALRRHSCPIPGKRQDIGRRTG